MTQPTVSGHRILERIGEGGMGEVFLAQDLQLHRKVALKFLSQDTLQDRHLRERFLREARNAASLNHPNICTVYHVGEVDEDVQIGGDRPRTIARGTPFLTMELVEGETLDHLVARSGPLPVHMLEDICEQVAEGLAEAHRRGIVHRDLKPQNVMRTGEGRIKILDFGLAKSVAPLAWGDEGSADATAPILTGQGAIMGTPAYMSPEQASGHDVSFPSDIFSFGLILSEMATGKRLFDSATAMATLAKIIEAEPEPLVRPDLPPSLVAVRNRCLRKNPSERYRNGEELLGALHTAAPEAPPTRTVQLRTPEEGPSPKGRRMPLSAPVLAGLLVLVMAVGAGVLYFGRGRVAENPTLAVLPFRQIGPEDKAYVAQGLTEEVTTRLSSLRGLEVVSSTSTLGYKDAQRDLREVARELNVRYLLEGRLTWGAASDTIRITCSLVDGNTGTTVWNGPFTASLNRFVTVQGDIAEQVARELDVRLLEPVRELLTDPPTKNAEAYDYFLRGTDAASRSYDPESAETAARMFARAVKADPAFALAHARLSMAESWMYWAGFDVSNGRLARARTAAYRSLELAPELPEGNLALGYYFYRCERNYDQALARFESVRESLPNDSSLFFALGAVHRRRGNLEAAKDEFERAFRLDPRSHVKAWETGETLRFVREFREADRYYGLAQELDPEFIWATVSRGELRLLGEGDAAGALKIMENAPPGNGSGTELAWLRVAARIFQEDYPGAIQVLQRQTFDHPSQRLVFLLWMYQLNEDEGGARAAADSLRKMMIEVVEEEPEEPSPHAILGLALAFLDDTEGALKEGREAVRLAGDDAIREVEMMYQLAWIQWTLGDRKATYALLQDLLARPSWLTRARLRVDPTFKDAREDPEFKTLLSEPPVPA